MQKNVTDTPSLFVFEDGDRSSVVDLNQVAALNRKYDGGYYLVCGGVSYPVTADYGDALRTAWIAFQGKFKPETAR